MRKEHSNEKHIEFQQKLLNTKQSDIKIGRDSVPKMTQLSSQVVQNLDRPINLNKKGVQKTYDSSLFTVSKDAQQLLPLGQKDPKTNHNVESDNSLNNQGITPAPMMMRYEQVIEVSSEKENSSGGSNSNKPPSSEEEKKLSDNSDELKQPVNRSDEGAMIPSVVLVADRKQPNYVSAMLEVRPNPNPFKKFDHKESLMMQPAPSQFVQRMDTPWFNLSQNGIASRKVVVNLAPSPLDPAYSFSNFNPDASNRVVNKNQKFNFTNGAIPANEEHSFLMNPAPLQNQF